MEYSQKIQDKKKSEKNSLQGKKNRAAGSRFELKVRNELESKGWIIDKWTNNIDLETGKLVKAKRKFNPYLKVLGIGTGFPDFIGIKKVSNGYDVMGVEVKINGWLDKTEKEKCWWLLKNKIFSKVLIAKKGKKPGQIEYVDFIEKYEK
ncbi:hypothetical protein K0A97_01430 [Patescibacteria group bacterium]|nr:hypothetical protein [Patescibacteria group bacterium]